MFHRPAALRARVESQRLLARWAARCHSAASGDAAEVSMSKHAGHIHTPSAEASTVRHTCVPPGTIIANLARDKGIREGRSLAEVSLEMRYTPQGNVISAKIAKLFGGSQRSRCRRICTSSSR